MEEGWLKDLNELSPKCNTNIEKSIFIIPAVLILSFDNINPMSEVYLPSSLQSYYYDLRVSTTHNKAVYITCAFFSHFLRCVEYTYCKNTFWLVFPTVF